MLMCCVVGGVPSGVLLHSVLDDLPALGGAALHPLPGPGDADVPGSPVSRPADRGRVHVFTSECRALKLFSMLTYCKTCCTLCFGWEYDSVRPDVISGRH